MKKFFIVGYLLFISIVLSNAQSQHAIQSQYKFKHITVDEGLSNNNVRSICQDSKGFIWMGTLNGADKYDGYTIVPHRNNPRDSTSISSNIINAIFADSHSNLWFGTRQGLDLYNSDFDNFFRFEHKDLESPIVEIFAVTEDKDEKLWFAGVSGLYAYDLNTSEIQFFKNNNDNIHGIPTGEIHGLLVDRNNNVWFSVLNYGLCLYDQKNRTFKSFKSNPNDPTTLSGARVERIYEDSKENIWVGTFNNGLNLYVPETSSFIRTIPDPNNNYSTRVRAIFEDLKGNFFIGTRGGIYIRNDQSNEFVPYANEEHNFSKISHNSILCSFIDRTNTLWVGTYAGGVNYTNLNRKEFIHYKAGKSDKQFLSGANIYAIAEDSKGDLWIGAENGLNHLDRTTYTFNYYTHQNDNPNSLSYNDIKTLDWDNKGNLWIGTNKGGLNYFNVETGNFKSYKHNPSDINSISGDKVYCVMNDIENNLWILTNSNIDNQYSSIDILPNGSDSFIHLSEKAYFGIEEDENGNVFIGGVKGFWFFSRADSIFSFISNDSLIGKVNTIKKDKGNRVWIGSKKGLVRYNLEDKSFAKFSYNNGYPISEVFGILEDNANNLWVSTNFGLVKIANIYDDINNYTIRVFDREDGLQSKQFNYNAFCKSESGEMFFGGINGFNSFNPSEIIENTITPDIMLTDLKIFNTSAPIGEKIGGRVILEKSISITDKIKLGRKQNVFSLEFAALHYANPEKNTFKYKLEGFDKNWQLRNVGNSVASYSNLPAGEYTFIVNAANNDGAWNEEPIKLSIIIIPPFYKRKLFVLLVIVIIGLLAYYAIKARESQLKGDKDKLETSLNDEKTKLEKQEEEIKKQEEEIKLRDEQERESKWFNTGLAKFSDVLSKNKENATTLNRAIITNLVEYLEADIGAIFLLNDDDKNKLKLDFSAGYAYVNENEESKVFLPGEGYVGTCYIKKETIILDNIPKDYLKIESGLGELAPSSIVLVPMKFDNQVSGVIEIASFNKIASYKIEFIEKIAESASSNITILKSEQQAKIAVEEANINAEKLKSADEELKQNIEEMTTIQEELNRNQDDLLEEQAMFQTLMDFLEDRITFKDPESVYLRINNAKSNALNLNSPNEAIRKSDKHFFGEEHFNKAYKSEKEIFDKGLPIINQEELLRFKDGTIKWGSTSRVPFKSDSGDTAGTLIITKDITEHKTLLSENHANKEFINIIAQNCPLIIYRMDKDFIINKISGNGIHRTNLQEKDFIGNSFMEAFDISKDQIEVNNKNQSIKSEFKTNNEVLSLEHYLIYNESNEGYFCCCLIN